MEVSYEDTEAYEFEYSVVIRAAVCVGLLVGGIIFCVVCHLKHEHIEKSQSVIKKNIKEPLLS